MQSAASYVAVATMRNREVKLRLLIGSFIAVAAWILAPTVWPVFWYATVVGAQFADRIVSKRMIRAIEAGSVGRTVSDYLCSTAVNVCIYTSISAYFWFSGGVAGSWFALLLCAGGMLHVSMRSYASTVILLAGVIPHGLCLVILLAVSVLSGETHGLESVIVIVGAAIYMTQLVAGVRQSKQAMASLQAATEEAQAARALAEQANAAKSEFLATVSHEIRTPMNAVLSAAHLLKRTPLNPEQEDHVAMLTNGGQVLVGLLNDVLDISKIEAGKMVLDHADLDLGEALDSLIKLYQPKTDASGVSLRLMAANDLPGAVRTDPLRLRQILFNLVSNAVKFTHEGEIIIRAGRGQGADRGEVWFEVSDSGIGIDAEAMARLFGSFEQAKAETARHHGGTGLGLAISRRLAEMMGGTLTCQSTLGEGSTFRLVLPLIETDATALAPSDAEAIAMDPGRRLSILVAEDHEVNRKIVGLFLEPLGWRLTMAKDGGEAVAMAGQESFDAILMDMQMPVMNGVDASMAIRRAGGPNAQAPIIALTANALGHHREAWEPVSVAGFLTKPINPELLVQTLIEATASRPPCLARSEAA